MPRAAPTVATRPAILPKPSRARRRPARSYAPAWSRICQWPRPVSRFKTSRFLLSASISATVCSATDWLLASGVLQTGTPRALAAATSMLSTPTPVRPMTRRAVAAVMMSRRAWSPCAPGCRRAETRPPRATPCRGPAPTIPSGYSRLSPGRGIAGWRPRERPG